MTGWHHQLDGHEFGWTLGVCDGQGGLACCDSWGHRESDTTERLNWIFHYICTISSVPIRLLMDIRLFVSMFWLLWIVLLWTLGCMCLFEIVFFWILRSGTAGSYSNSIFSFPWNHLTVFHSDYSNPHSHQQCKRVPLFHTLSSIYYL